MNRKHIYGLLFIWIALTITTRAQSPLVDGSEQSQSFCSSDPILSILDSLISIDNVIRYKNANPLGNEISLDISNSIPSFTAEEYADKISRINSPIPLVYNQQVRQYIDLYAVKKRGLTSRVMGLSNLYFPMYEETLEKNGLPLEFKYLSIVESALNPTAVSCVGATGLWQFMFNTGKLYGLEINSYIDERKDPLKSTEAACKYFKNMYEMYHDWLLVIASYNCGPGNVNKAILRSGGKTNFWEISKYLPAETRGYVPAFIAVTYLMQYSKDHNLNPIPPSITYFETDTVSFSGRVSFSTISQTLDLPIDVISFLNPIYKKQVTPNNSVNTLRLPANKIAQFVSNEALIIQKENTLASLPPSLNLPGKYASINDPNIQYEYVQKTVKKVHIVKKGETLTSIADKYNTNPYELKKLNRIKGTKVSKGQKLYVLAVQSKRIVVRKPTVKLDSVLVTENLCTDSSQNVLKASNTDNDIENPSITKGKNNITNAPDFVYHQVQRGDTLYSIAKIYDGVTIDQLMKMNNISNGKSLKPGMKLKVKISDKS